jgi:hypothetical protein
MLGHVSKSMSASHLDLNNSTCHLECQQHRRCDTSQLPPQWSHYAMPTPRSGPSKTKLPEEQGKNDGPMLDMPLLSSQPHHHHLNAIDTRHLVCNLSPPHKSVTMTFRSGVVVDTETPSNPPHPAPSVQNARSKHTFKVHL